MARGKTLIYLLDEFRAEARRSLNPAHGNQVRDTQVKLLQRTQEWLWQDFDWPHLSVRRDVPLQAGQRYIDVPEDMDIERITMIEVRYNGRWIRLVDGIGADHYATYDSDAGDRAWPVQRVQLYEDDQLEVWPIPDQDGDLATLEGMLRFTGIRKLNPLVNDEDRCDLDARLITLFAASDALAADGAKDAQQKLSEANKLYNNLRSNQLPNRPFKMFGKSTQAGFIRRGPPPIYYRVVGS